MPLHAPAEMGPGRPAFLANGPDHLALGHDLTLLHQHLRLMQVGRDQALSVVQQGQAALEVKTCFSKGHKCAGGSMDRRSRWRSHVVAIVRSLGHPIQNALAAKSSRQPEFLQRKNEACPEILTVRPTGKANGLARRFSGNPGQQGLTLGIDLVFSQAADLLDVENAWCNARHMFGGAFGRYGAYCGFRFCVPVKADDEQALRRSLPFIDPIHIDLRPRPGAADQGAALLRAAGELQGNIRPRRPGKPQGAKADKGLPAGGGQEFFSRQRARDSAGPA